MFLALRVRDFRLLWSGGAISYLGSWLLVLAVPADIFLVTKSLGATGLTLACEYAPQLFLGPVAGVLTDRWNRRLVMIWSNLGRGVIVAAMLFALAPGRYWIFYLALVAESAGTALATPALRARIPAVVGTGPLLTSANSLNSLTSGAVRLVGGPIGGILFAALGIRVLIVADALSYLVAAAAILATAREPNQVPSSGKAGAGGLFGDLREGLAILMRERSARALLPVSVIFLAANACLTSVVVAFGLTRLGGSQATGMLFSALGIGFLAGAPVIRFTLDRVCVRYLLCGSLAATAVGYLALFHSTSLRSALPAAVGIGLSGSMSLVVPQTAVQRAIPNEALGRIGAVFLTGEAAATLAGALIGPLLVRSIALTGLAAAASLATAVAAAVTLAGVPSVSQQPSTASTAAQGQQFRDRSPRCCGRSPR